MTRSHLLKEATSCLQIRDIYLYGSLFKHLSHKAVNSKTAFQQGKKQTSYTIDAEREPNERYLQVLVELGTRLVLDKESPDETAQLVIEADFVVEYRIVKEVSDDAIQAFVDFNAVHNVWPFWRQHVFDVVQRGHLPQLQVPFFPGIHVTD